MKTHLWRRVFETQAVFVTLQRTLQMGGGLCDACFKITSRNVPFHIILRI